MRCGFYLFTFLFMEYIRSLSCFLKERMDHYSEEMHNDGVTNIHANIAFHLATKSLSYYIDLYIHSFFLFFYINLLICTLILYMQNRKYMSLSTYFNRPDPNVLAARKKVKYHFHKEINTTLQ